MTSTTSKTRRFNGPVAVESQSIEARTKLLLKTGNDQLASEFIAKKAAEHQALRDAGLKEEIKVRTRALVGTVAEVGLTGTGGHIPTPVFTDLTIDQLRAHATEHGLEIAPSLRSKADIAAAVAAAHAAKYPGEPTP